MSFTQEDIKRLSNESGYSESDCREALQYHDKRDVVDIMTWLKTYCKPKN